MTKEELELHEKEIIKQMGVEDINEVYLKEDWSKVDPEIREKYVKYIASCLEKTMKNLQSFDENKY